LPELVAFGELNLDFFHSAVNSVVNLLFHNLSNPPDRYRSCTEHGPAYQIFDQMAASI